jgi:hypothetical protein
MNTAVNNFQKTVFILLLWSSGFLGVVANIAFSNNKSFYIVYDILIFFLAWMSISYLNWKLSVILLFLFICIGFNLSYNGNSLVYSLNGLREILNLLFLPVFLNKVFSEDNEALAEEYLKIMKIYSIVFLIAQIPVAFYQFSVHGPSDWVGGTYGSFGSGILSLSIVCHVFFLSHFIKNISLRILLYCMMVPMLLNETKVSFILIPMVMLFIHFEPRLKNIMIAGVAAAVSLFIFSQYFSTGNSPIPTNVTEIFSKDFLQGYLFGDIYTYTDVPRFTKIVLGWQMLAEHTNTFLFGFEYGVFRSSEMMDLSRFAQSVEWLMTGTRPYLFFLMIQGGVMLVTGIMVLIFYINNFFVANNNKYKTFLFLLFLIILFYNDALRNQNFCIIYFFSIFFANSSIYNKITERPDMEL